ncbi:molybdenum cofactor biosynthesis protein MoaE [Phyllobacterium leguminum]|uniref:Molybdopterin synthase catalytic subunit n=1 Tax=Phyllobacterium leguminum TaxID=314237 RepID=A0A318T3H7_9HYPH|nr:molybdenum cofactor biosynthesis protein MoaE [Phyllobacterium leguminum]PYE87238.1 molybdopterin synthase subunit MoaE [Phyllobacterium leguminum]
MSAPVIPHISVQRDDFDLAREITALTAGRTDIGAVVTFSGLCRDEGETLAALELEHYPGMAEMEIERIAGAALERWPLLALRIIHRHGKILPGENIVLVITTSAHRQAAFEAASFLMDFLKTRAPFWKKEHARNGQPAGWVEPKASDEGAQLRWDAIKPGNAT